MPLENDLGREFQNDTRMFAQVEAEKARWQKMGQGLDEILRVYGIDERLAFTILRAIAPVYEKRGKKAGDETF